MAKFSGRQLAHRGARFWAICLEIARAAPQDWRCSLPVWHQLGPNSAEWADFCATVGKGYQTVSEGVRQADLGVGPATAMQQGLLLESTLAGRPWANLEQIVVEGAGPGFTLAAMRTAWMALTARHDALRMVLASDGRGGFGQSVLAVHEPDLAEHDFSGLADDDEAAAVEDYLTQDRQAGLDPREQPGWRVRLLRFGAEHTVMVWTIHHALIDGTSMAIVLEELGQLLAGNRLCSVQGPDFAAFSAGLSRHDKTAAQQFFATMFADGADLVPLASPGPSTLGRMALRGGALSRKQTAALRERVQEMGATPLNAVQAAWALVLARWTGQDQACFGLVDSGRQLMPGLEQTVGCLIATLPFRVRLESQERLGSLLARLRQMTLEMRPHCHASLTEVRRWAGLPGDTRIFETLVMYAHASLPGRMRGLGGPWEDWPVRLIEEGTAAATLAVADEAEMQILIEHDPARIDAEMANSLLAQMMRLLMAIAKADADTPLGELGMLSADEISGLLALGAPDFALAPSEPCLASRFETIAAARPDAPAVIEAGTGRVTSYRDLDRAANGFAARLQAAGVRSGDVVAVRLPRGADHVMTLLAILKLGAAFLPLDPDLPEAWLADLRHRAGASVLVTTEGADLGAELVLAPGAGLPQDMPPTRPAPDPGRLAYVIFTSGSTGVPKGVRGLCGALSAHASATIAAFDLAPQDRVLHFAGLGFDVALEEIFPTLLAGATVVVRDAPSAESIRGFVEFLAREAVTVANLPASFWHVMVEEMARGGFAFGPALRLVIAGSERINPQALRLWREIAPDVVWMNGYGPTETTITATALTLRPGQPLPAGLDEVPIGRPLAHARAVLRAFDGSLTPLGGTGMLWIGGPAVTGGYLGDAPGSQGAFQPDPWSAPDDVSARIYSTGDQARWRRDGQLEFLGRRDRQVKLRGQRIDLYQVERHLVALSGVRLAHVAMIGEPSVQLVAWVVSEAGVTADQITAEAALQMPRAMVPQIIIVKSLPVGANGKIDTRALPAPSDAPNGVGRPDWDSWDSLTQAIAACMAEVLGMDQVPPEAQFSDLGGDSLLALRLVSLIEARTGHALLTANLHHHGSAAALAAMLQSGVTAPRYTIPIQPEGTRPPFFAIHVLGRNEDLFRPLAAALGPDQPVFGLSVGMPRNLDDINVERTARIYFDEIQTYFPTGPVALGAVSMAAYFAYELAQLLHAAGREVRVLAVLDAMGPDGRPALEGAAKFRAHLNQVRLHGLWHFGRVLKNRIDRYRERREALRSAPDQVNAHNLIAANVCAVEFYRPKPYDGPLTVFRADHSFWDSPEALRTGLGWASVARGGLVMHDLPGTHLSILHPGNVEVLAAHLRRLIAEKAG